MLSRTHYYHRIIRKMVVSFGTMFNNIMLKRYNKAGTVEIERITVPLTYSSKEKFYVRITQDPNLAAQLNVVLPRMAFELTNISYDPLRKTSSFIEQFTTKNSNELRTVKRTPYNFEFSLYIFVRNVEDGTQIVEQILPYFTPDYTLTVDLIDDNSLKADVPIVFQTVSQDITDDTGESDQLRTIVWTLTFTMKGWMYGPIDDGKLIRKVTANTFYDNSSDTSGDTQLNLGPGSGIFKIGELVYQGYSLDSARTTAYVKAHDPTANILIVTETFGDIKANTLITGAVTNASYNVVSFGTPDYQLTRIVVQPDPLSANANDAFGFTETITSAPFL
jgi:hypothetical protein